MANDDEAPGIDDERAFGGGSAAVRSPWPLRRAPLSFGFRLAI